MQETFTRSLNFIPKNKQEDIMNEIANLRSDYDIVVVKIGTSNSNLKAIDNRRNLLMENKDRLNNWLNEKEMILESIIQGKGDINEMKVLLERLKYLESEIIQKKPEIQSLQEDMSYFDSIGLAQDDKTKLNGIIDGMSTLKTKCLEKISEFEIEIGDFVAYQYQLQEIEKWLLQISFQLMAHNSLYISNYDQTKEQIAQHETLLGIIQKYQQNIDDLNDKGQQQIRRYEPYSNVIHDKINSQLKNIQESYNSLLQTSIQIKNRLHDSLNKFKEYEETLESILKNLDEFEKVIDQENDKDVETLNDADTRLKLMNNFQDKLHQEKHRLMLAVQACEAATASISRPSSPVFNQSSTIPEKELIVRAKLDDLIDKILPIIDTLMAKIKSFDEIILKRDELNEWINEQTAIANDISSKPSKLRSEPISQQVKTISGIMAETKNKQNMVLTEFQNQLSDDEIENFEKRLDALETLLLQICDNKGKNESLINEYLKNINESKALFDKFTQNLEVLDEPYGNNEQKVNDLLAIKKGFESEMGCLKNKLQSNCEKIMKIVSHLDAQQVDDQLKALHRRENELMKRIDRKMQLLDLISKNMEKVKLDIDQSRLFFDENVEKLSQSLLLGYMSKPIENFISNLKSLSKDTENKQSFIESMTKRILNMQSDVGAVELQKLKQSINDLQSKEKTLQDLIKAKLNQCQLHLGSSKDLENNVDVIKVWVNEQGSFIESNPIAISFAPSAIDYEMKEQHDRLDRIREYKNSILESTKANASSIKEQCDDDGKRELENIIDNLSKDIDEIERIYNDRLEIIKTILQKKKEYEQDSDGLANWIKDIQHIMSSQVKTSSIQILEEHARKYENIMKEKESKVHVLKAIEEKANALAENLSEVDKLNLTSQVKNLTDKFNLLDLKLHERLDGILNNIKQLKESQTQISEYTQFILSIQHAIKELNKPIGSKTEDVLNLLKEYENILNRLKAKKSEVKLQKISELPQIKELLSTHDDIIDAIENQLKRLKQLSMLREQFIALINEIVNFNTKYTDITNNIEKSADKPENKVKQYDKIMQKIHECEGLLISATDKGMQIASEGNVEDRNNIIEQLQTLKNKTKNLKQMVENLRRQHEKTANLQKTYEIEITKALNLLYEREMNAKILPVLDVDTESVEQELKKHHQLDSDIEVLSLKLQNILNEVEKDNKCESSMFETVSAAKLLLKGLPELLNERKNYLDNNKTYRFNFIKNVTDFNNQIDEMETNFLNVKDDIDFENVSRTLNNFTSYISTRMPEIESNLDEINKNIKAILPSLNNVSKEELLRDLQKYISCMKKVKAGVEKSKIDLQNNHDLWSNYNSLLQLIEKFLTSVLKDGPLNSIDELNKYLQFLNSRLSSIQVSKFY
jgi:nesprin-1